MTHTHNFLKKLVEFNRISCNYDSLENPQSITHENESPGLSEEDSIYSFISNYAI